MKRTIVAGALSAAALAVAVIAQAEEPKGFGDVPWGASEDTLRLRIPTQSCSEIDPTVDYGSRRCRARADVKFADVSPSAVFFYFRNDMLVAWRITSSPRVREALAKALIRQYGKPTLVYKGNHVRWQGRTSDVDFVGGPNQDIVEAVTKAEVAIREAERLERARRTVKRP